MDIGTGIAIAGVWIFAMAAMASKSVSSFGVILAITVAASVTIYLK